MTARARPVRVSAFTIFAVGFVLLLGAAGAAAWGQFSTSHLAPWVSMGLSGASIVATLVAIWLRPRR